MRFTIFSALVVVCFIQFVVGSMDARRFGFGVQRLRQHEQLQAAADCGSSVEYYFSKAVVDNFAPVDKIQYWAGSGQRYWINKEFFGGKGSPVFVFIGGVSVASTCIFSSLH